MTTRYTYTMGTREQRRNRRAVRSALKVTVGKQTYQALNWSLGGLLIEDAESQSGLEPDNVVRGRMTLGSGKTALSVDFVAVVVRIEAEGHVALTFDTIDEPLFAFFEACLKR